MVCDSSKGKQCICCFIISFRESLSGWQARNLGPWSSARQLIEARAKATADRADKRKGKAAGPGEDASATAQVNTWHHDCP